MKALIAGLIGLLLSVPAVTFAVESAPVSSRRTTATLITEYDSVMPKQSFQAALRLHLAPGWHTYWQNPGDAGVPPAIDLTLSPGSTAGSFEWPLPQRIAEGPLTTYAYTGDVVLPFTVTAGEAPFTIKAHAEWLACKDICVPEAADLQLDLPLGPATVSSQAAIIKSSLERVPPPASGLATITPNGALTVSDDGMSPDVVSAEFFPSRAGAVERTTSSTPRRDGQQITFQFDPVSASDGQASPGVLALTNRAGIVSAIVVTPRLVAEPQAAAGLGSLLLLAFAGGLLLNLMPCVFPILAMKAMALARLSGTAVQKVRGEAASYSAGVVLTFVALGGGLMMLRAAGRASGWGFQFQSPLFVTGVAWLLFAIGLSLSGVYTVGGSFVGLGNSLARKGGHFGSFVTGVLAVAVASPCTAPFMGTAIAGALALPGPAALAVFAGLGVGLASPYMLIAMVPRLSSILPRPGAWMQTLQQLLAFPMYAAAVWLIWVVSQQAGPSGVLTVCIGLLAIAVGGWALGFAAHRTGWSRRVARASALTAGLALAALMYTAVPRGGPSDTIEPFTAARLQQLQGEGRPVFVNMTAAWCLSCLVNERIALSLPAVRDAFAQSNVAYLKGDWTSQNPAISDYLHKLGQDGVPLYVLYAPGRAPVVLPQLLSESAVLAEVAKLRG